MNKNIEEMASIVKGEVLGDKETLITGFSGIKEAKKGDLTFLANSKYIPFLKNSQASAVVVSPEMSIPHKTVIKVDNPSAAFAVIISSCIPSDKYYDQGIHPKAIVSDKVELGKNVSIGPCSVIEDNVKIQDNTVIYPGCYVGHHTTLGEDCVIYPNTTIREHISVGDRVIIHSGTVIGDDGFGYIQIDGLHQKIPQIGTVLIEDDVEIGSNVTIDRARFDKTIIGKGTKIDNLVQIAHNVILGKNCIIVAQCGISGSTIIEDGCILAGQSGIVGHLTIGKNTIVAARGMVTKSLKANSMYSGVPVKQHREAKRINACVQRLPLYVKAIQDLKLRIEDLESKLN